MKSFPGGSIVKNPPATQETQVQSLSWKDPGRRKWQPTPIVLPGKLYEQRSLVGYSSCNFKDLDATGWLSKHALKYMSTHVHSSIIDSSQMAEATKMSTKGYPSLKNKSVQFSSVTQSCLTLCNPMECSMPGFPVHHQLPELVQTHAHQVGDAIQQSHPLLSRSPPPFSISQHQCLFQSVSSSHQVAKVLELQLQHQSFKWMFRTDFL